MTAKADDAEKPSLAAEKSASGRDPILDMLRGWCIVMMVTSHIGHETAQFHLSHLQRYLSAAEGFVFLSGVVLGMVHRRRIEQDKRRESYRKIWHRAGMLWVVNSVLILLALLFHETTGLIPFLPDVANLGGWGKAVVDTALLAYDLPSLNILSLYVLFLALAPFALASFERGWAGACLALSGALYLLGQWRHPEIEFFQRGNFHYIVWQFLFLLGLAVGYFRQMLTQKVWPSGKAWLWPVSLVMFLALFVLSQLGRSFVPANPFSNPALQDFVFDRAHLRAGRLVYLLVNLALCYGLLSLLLQRGLATRPLGWLETLGRNSLYCYIVQSLFAYVSYAVNAQEWPWALQEVVMALALAALYCMAKNRVLARIIPN